ncbi:ribose-phosphate pyrophosphokinase 4-like isoform X1 [Actinidia eriantha]|uniref:ribose-phosphate pyrophosphokinase 4-like isoform X1 n=1 Tax=Actinidia eriantha TaxID=165200 RepID=UPI002586217F|nr:ribose-phosphate pyrophosphokinase 4-like isoform X1 [Actinidia eriantha]
MSTTRPPLPSPSTNPSKTLNPIFSPSLLPHPQRLLRSYAKNFQIRCELRSFNDPQTWTVDCVTGSDPIHIILKPPPFSIPMGSNSGLGSNSMTAKKVCLFHCAEMKALAERIAAESDAIELRSITWRTFEDGFPNLFISNAHGIRGQHVAFLASFSSPGVIFEQLSVIYALPKLFVSSFTVVLPFFPTGTSERMEEEGDVATAFTLARILSNIPISKGGPTSLVVFDIHALQERFYFGDNVLPCFESAIPLLKNRLQQLPDSDNISIAFPDDGAWKRFHKQLQHFPMIVCAKVREGDQRIVRIKEGDPRGRHVVIVDDLVQSGGTLIECQKVLAKHGAAKISAYVTHGIFPKRSWERFDHDNGGRPENGFTYFWITDSCPTTVKEVKNRLPFEVLSLASSIAASLQI